MSRVVRWGKGNGKVAQIPADARCLGKVKRSGAAEVVKGEITGPKDVPLFRDDQARRVKYRSLLQAGWKRIVSFTLTVYSVPYNSTIKRKDA